MAPLMLFAQSGTKWATNGNSTSPGEFLGTTNNQPLIIKTNGLERMQITGSGSVQLNSLSGLGNALVTTDLNGNLIRTNYSGNSTDYLGGDGQFHNVGSASGWTVTGSNVYHYTGNVGIGTSSPQYLLDVNGDAWFSGTVYATGVILTNKLLADTMKAGDMIALNENLHFSAGGLNEVYTSTGELRFQSNAGNNNNVLFSAGTSGYVGIGTFNPQAKLDVNGDVIFRGKTTVNWILSSTGDSIVRLGDSTMYLNYGNGTIYTAGPVQGIGIGHFTGSTGFSSCAIGYRVHSPQPTSVTIGSGVTNGPQLFNTVANSLVVGFNSTVATLFVGPSSGVGTVGKVGVGTSTPFADFQVGQGFTKLCAGSTPGQASNYSTSYVGFNIGKQANNDWFIENDFVNNGAALIMGDIFGNLRFININTNGASNRNLTDQQVQANTTMTIRRDGRVVIGNQTQSGGSLDVANTLLTVNGTIVSQKLHISADNWADSIFSPEYSLMPLDSVGLYIKSFQHLPGVPSAQEVKTSGTDVAQMDVILLAKVEELTLYMLQLQEENEKLRQRIQNLENNGDK